MSELDDEVDRAALLRMFPDWERPQIDEVESDGDRRRATIRGAAVVEVGTDLPASWHQAQGSGRHWLAAHGEIEVP